MSNDIPSLQLQRAMDSADAAISNVIVKARRVHGVKYAENIEDLAQQLLTEMDRYRHWADEEVDDE